MLDFYYRGRIGGSNSVATVFRTLLAELVRRGQRCAIFPDERSLGTTLGRPLLDHVVGSPLQERRAARVGISGCAPSQYRTHVVGVLRSAIVNFEARVRLPFGPRTAISLLDLALPSSRFSDAVLEANGVPASARAVLPHAIDVRSLARVSAARAFDEFTILVVAANHARKNIARCIEVVSAALPNARLLLRVNPLRTTVPRKRFEIDMSEVMTSAPANVTWLRDDFDDVSALYARAHVVLSLSSGEGFGLPLLEGLAAGCLVVAPRYSGPLDFLNDANSLLIDTTERATPPEAQYLPDDSLDPSARDGWPDFEHAVALLRRAHASYETLHAEHQRAARPTLEAHEPSAIIGRLLALCKAKDPG